LCNRKPDLVCAVTAELVSGAADLAHGPMRQSDALAFANPAMTAVHILIFMLARKLPARNSVEKKIF
jgi:hypothetical protein